MFLKNKKNNYLAGIILLGVIFIGYYVNNIYAQTKNSAKKYIFQSVLNNQWYSNNPQTLSKKIDQYLELAKKNFHSQLHNQKIDALILPHAGHAYSGLCAASGYIALQNNQAIESIILLAPSHYLHVKGIVRPHFTHYETALGILTIDQTKKEFFAQIPHTSENPEAYAKEHALEIQFPFIQKCLPQAKILPLLVGEVDANSIEVLAQGIIDCLDEKTVIIVSSDFIHYGEHFQYLPFSNQLKKNIIELDQEGIKAISQCSLSQFQNYITETHATICGKNAITLLLKIFEKQNQKRELHSTCSYLSPQAHELQDQNITPFPSLFFTQDDQLYRHTVSYNALIFTKNSNSAIQIPTYFEEKILLALARSAIEKKLKKERHKELILPLGASLFNKKYGAFVTLTNKKNQLKGCIGRITTQEPLTQTINNMALAAAFDDHRFAPIQEDDLEDLIIQISLLSLPMPIESLEEFKIGIDGIIFTKNNSSGQPVAHSLFLPEVAQENNWTKEETARQLSIKAGLAPDAWKDKSAFAIFKTIKISE